MLLSLGLIALGLARGIKPAAPNDFDAALTQVEELIAAGELDMAGERLQRAIEPHLKLASSPQQARFHAAVADYLSARRIDESGDDEAGSTIDLEAIAAKIAQHYAKAADLGLTGSPRQWERWTEALLAVGDVATAQERLKTWDAMLQDASADPQVQAEVSAIRNRIFRLLVQTMLEKPDVAFDEVMTMLAEYRLSRSLAPADEMWAIARQTDLRLRAGEADIDKIRQAMDLLIVEMRRLENRDLALHGPALGELYMLLGRGYYDLGDYGRARGHLEHSLHLFDGPESARGESLTLLGQIEMASGETDAALERFQLVVRDFVATPSFLAGLVGQAEAKSILGSHEDSLADFRLVCDYLNKPRWRSDVTAVHAADVLCDRCDAALSIGKIDVALDYVSLAEHLFSNETVPASVLIRLASVCRQMGETLLSQAAASAPESDAEKAAPLDPAVRYEANTYFERSGEYYLRHASAAKPSEHAVEESSQSLWLAADSFDLGGRHDLAIKYFTRYLEMHPIDDQRRPEVSFRLAQACQAVRDVERASQTYESIIANYSRGAYGPRSYVPLARCYIEMNRMDDARQQLQQVLSGGRLVHPEAVDYREALLELARLEYRIDRHAAAIESCTEFLQRYPTDRRILEVRFMLAESYRASAQALSQHVQQEVGLSASEAGRLTALHTEHLQMALDLFAQVESAAAGPDAKEGSATGDMIRRAALYQADCAFDLGRYEQAIQLYDYAARQYSAHACSMYALIQIVNSYSAVGDAERAAAAHQRALARLRQLPESAFAAPDSLMDRAAWERWLEQTPVLPSRTAAASAGG